VLSIDGIRSGNLAGNAAMLATSLSLLDRPRTTPDEAVPLREEVNKR
jgi:hypothetical protein